MAEFDLIEQYFKFSPVQDKAEGITKGVGDDCAILDIPIGKQLVTSVDTLVAGVHFFEDASPADIAYKALAANLSDIAAMGATAKWFTLAISLPEINHAWLAEFSESLQQACQQFEVELIGGDTTQGPLNISISVFGLVDTGQALTRCAAKANDDIWITGALGSADYALQLHSKVQANQELSINEQQIWESLTRPQIPLAFAQQLPTVAHSAIDISDGLKADLGHILKQSQCGAKLQLMSLPISPALIDTVGVEVARNYALSGGDDYQLCFTAPKSNRSKVMALASQNAILATRIGTITRQGFDIFCGDMPYHSTTKSWQHFSND